MYIHTHWIFAPSSSFGSDLEFISDTLEEAIKRAEAVIESTPRFKGDTPLLKRVKECIGCNI